MVNDSAEGRAKGKKPVWENDGGYVMPAGATAGTACPRTGRVYYKSYVAMSEMKSLPLVEPARFGVQAFISVKGG